MMDKILVIITGGPGTGKSYMTGQILRNIDGLTVLSFDEIKEKNFDIYGYDDRMQKDRLNAFSMEEFYLKLQKQMWLSECILIEYPFYQRHKPRLTELIDTYGYRAITIHLYGELKTIYDRGAARDSNDDRHLGHLTSSYHIETYRPEELVWDAAMTYEQFCEMYQEKDYDIKIGEDIQVDVTDIPAIPYEEVLERIREVIRR